MTYNKIEEFIKTLYDVFNVTNEKSRVTKDIKWTAIAQLIYNYMYKKAYENFIDVRSLSHTTTYINMVPFFEYINYCNIELYDLDNLEENDVDMNKEEDKEKYILSYIYYITRK
jgi:hypothetical protein